MPGGSLDQNLTSALSITFSVYLVIKEVLENVRLGEETVFKEVFSVSDVTRNDRRHSGIGPKSWGNPRPRGCCCPCPGHFIVTFPTSSVTANIAEELERDQPSSEMRASLEESHRGLK